MLFNKKIFLKDLKTCLPGVETGSTIVNADNFVFLDGKVSSYNGAIAVTVPLHSDNEVTMEGAVDAVSFFDIISKLPNDEFDIDVSNSLKWKIKCGKIKVEISTKPFDYENRVKLLTITDEWIDVPEDFHKGIKVCKMARNKTTLAGIYFNDKYILSTNNYQINQYVLNDVKLPRFWVSDKCIDIFIKMHDIKKIQLSKGWVHMCDSDNNMFSARSLVNDKYPYDKILQFLDFNESDVMASGVFTTELANAVNRAFTFGMQSKNGLVVKLILDRDTVNVSAYTDNGSYDETVEWNNTTINEPITLYIDTDLLNFVTNTSYKFFVRSRKNSVPLVYFSADNSSHLFSTYTMDN